MPRLAIVIDAVGSLELLEGTLVSVLENRPSDCEILVVLDQPYADPYQLGDEVRFVQARGRAGWAHAINEALATSRAPLLHLLASGATVCEGWTERALSCFGDRHVGVVVPLVMDADQPERILAAGVGYRSGGRGYLVARGHKELSTASRMAIAGASHVAAFYRRTALDLIGGLCTQLGAQQADVDAGLAMARAGLKVVLEPQSRVLAAAQAVKVESPARRSLCEERLFWRNLAGPRRGRAIAAHAALVTIEAVLSIPRPRLFSQLAARLLACCQIGAYLRRWAVLNRLGEGKAGLRSANERLRVDPSHKRPSLAGADKPQVRAR